MRLHWTSFALTACLAMASAVKAQTMHAPDGGARVSLQSISVPEKPGAPFRAVVVTSFKRRLEDGTTVTTYNRRTIARDSTGKVFQERRYLMPNGNTVPSPISGTEYYDPVRNELTVCKPATHSCTVSPWRMNLGDAPPLPASTSTADGYQVTRESLGTSTIENLEALGSREISTSLRLGRTEPTVKEFWYSPRLGMNIVVKRFDPRSGAEDFHLEGIDLSEPDPRLFQPPYDYKTSRPVEQ